MLYGAEEILPHHSYDNDDHVFNGAMTKIKSWMSGNFK
jgi:hypothetical protein